MYKLHYNKDKLILLLDILQLWSKLIINVRLIILSIISIEHVGFKILNYCKYL